MVKSQLFLLAALGIICSSNVQAEHFTSPTGEKIYDPASKKAYKNQSRKTKAEKRIKEIAKKITEEEGELTAEEELFIIKSVKPSSYFHGLPSAPAQKK